MSSRVRLTSNRIATHACLSSESQSFLWDSVTPGLGVRATASKKVYIFQGRLGQHSIRITIGNVEIWTIEQARNRARELQGQIDRGRDPREVKRERIAADQKTREAARINSEPALTAWRDYVTTRSGRWSARHMADHELAARDGGEPVTRGRRPGAPAFTEPGALRPLLDLPLKNITRETVASWLDIESARRPARARLTLSLLTTFLNWCGNQPAYKNQVNPDACTKLKRELPKPTVRTDCLQREQLPLWFAHIRQIDNPVISAYLQTLLLAGARREELLSLQWADIDFQWQTIHLSDKVEDAGRIIPLTPYVGQLLQSLPRINEWVFASKRAASGRLQEPRKAHNRALEAAGLPALTLHGLRRSFATLSEWVEVPAGVVAQIMGHKPSAIAERHYKRRPVDLLRVWHTKIEEWILAESGVAGKNSKTTLL